MTSRIPFKWSAFASNLITGSVTVYVIVAFASWSLNVQAWESGWRFAFGLMLVFVLLYSLGRGRNAA